ncbi:hypothetical protein ABT075_11245 [Streptomyces sp. NPDC002677]|uniref:hypothetical protein n=1 Tax=Streptomyces sp. NPDC002677 TaxID=3154774 RepID=UPI00331C38C5
MAEKDAGEKRTARRSWRDVPLTPVALKVVAGVLLKFLGALLLLAFALVSGSGFSAGKLLDAVLDLVGGLFFACLFLWLFARLRSRKGRPSPGS